MRAPLLVALGAGVLLGCSALLDFDRVRNGERDQGVGDLAGADLTGVIEDLAGADLTGVVEDLAGLDLTGLDLTGTGSCLPAPGGPFFDTPFFEQDAPSYPRSLAVADIDADGKPDLVVGTDSNNLYVLKNAGGRTFVAGVGYPSGCTSGYHYALLVGDFDTDGKQDVLDGCNNFYGGVSVTELAFLKGDGAGGFAAPVQLSNRASEPFAGAVGDLDGDGTTDAVVISKGENGVAIYWGAANAATFTGQTPLRVATAYDPWAVAVGPLGGDGVLDLVVANGGGNVGDMAVAPGSVHVLRRGRAAGMQRTYAAGSAGDMISLGPVQPLTIAIANLDGDAHRELVMNPVGTAVYIAKGGGGATGPTTYGTFAVGPAAFKSPRGLAVGDLDCDGIDDAALTHFTLIADPDYDRYEIYRGGNGSLTQKYSRDVSTAGSPSTDRVKIVDLDGDKHPDVVMTMLGGANGKIRILWGRATAP